MTNNDLQHVWEVRLRLVVWGTLTLTSMQDDTIIEQLMVRTSRWAELPEELIIHIVSNLDATRDRVATMCTCKAWRNAAATCTHSLAFQFPPGQRTTIRKAQQHNALVKLAAHHCVEISTVKFAQWHGLEDAALVALLAHAAPRIEVAHLF